MSFINNNALNQEYTNRILDTITPLFEGEWDDFFAFTQTIDLNNSLLRITHNTHRVAIFLFVNMRRDEHHNTILKVNPEALQQEDDEPVLFEYSNNRFVTSLDKPVEEIAMIEVFSKEIFNQRAHQNIFNRLSKAPILGKMPFANTSLQK